MNKDQSLRIAVAFARETLKSPGAGVCRVCVDVLHVAGAGISIMGDDAATPISVSTPHVAVLEDVQFTVGQGPCQDAFVTGLPVGTPSFDTVASDRWPSFVDLARAVEIGAVFAFPLVVDGAKIGALTLYQHSEGPLTEAQHDDSVAIAAVVAEAVLSLQGMSASGTPSPDLDDVAASRAEVYQASGMVATQLAIPADEALLRIRGHAFAHNVPIVQVAADIVARRLRLTDDSSSPEHEEH